MSIVLLGCLSKMFSNAFFLHIFRINWFTFCLTALICMCVYLHWRHTKHLVWHEKKQCNWLVWYSIKFISWSIFFLFLCINTHTHTRIMLDSLADFGYTNFEAALAYKWCMSCVEMISMMLAIIFPAKICVQYCKIVSLSHWFWTKRNVKFCFYKTISKYKCFSEKKKKKWFSFFCCYFKLEWEWSMKCRQIRWFKSGGKFAGNITVQTQWKMVVSKSVGMSGCLPLLNCIQW